MKKFVSLVLIFVLALSVCACSHSSEEVAEPTESTEPVSGVANPMHDATLESLAADMGIDFSVFADYENVLCFKIDGEPVIAEVNYTSEGDEYTFRLALTAAEQDISGMYCTWTETSEVDVGYCTAKVSTASDGTGVIVWYDAVPGVMYSISMSANAAAEKLVAMANAVFVPTQGESDGDFETAFGELLAEIHSTYFPGTAGSSINGAVCAAKLADLFAQSAGLYAEPSEFAAAVSAATLKYTEGSFSDDAERQTFASQVSGVVDSYKYLAEGNIGVLSDGGYEAVSYPWDETAVGGAFDAMNDAVRDIIPS